MSGKRRRNPGRNKDFTETEIAILSLNPNVTNITAKQINYKDSFKLHFVAEHAAGKSPLQIVDQIHTKNRKITEKPHCKKSFRKKF